MGNVDGRVKHSDQVLDASFSTWQTDVCHVTDRYVSSAPNESAKPLACSQRYVEYARLQTREGSMASCCVPVTSIRDAGSFGASLNRAPVRSRWFLRLYYFPKLLSLINQTLGGEALGRLTFDQASELYGPLSNFHQELVRFCDSFANKPFLVRLILGRWMRSVEQQVDRMGDIVETLAWATDESLRRVIDSAIHATEQQTA
jgi:hypothetical protein